MREVEEREPKPTFPHSCAGTIENKVAPDRLETITVPLFGGLPWLACGFSTRPGGASTAYRRAGAGGDLDLNRGLNRSLNRTGDLNLDLNLGFTAEDAPQTVAANREKLLRDVAGPLGSYIGLVTVRQTHSTAIHRVGGEHVLDLARRAALEGDGLMTNEPGVLLGILTADCVPVTIVDPLRRTVAAFHAGWRGTVEQIVEQGVARMEKEFGSEPATLLAAIGPAIGACCYRVGAEVVERFTSRFPYAETLFTKAVMGQDSEDGSGDGSGESEQLNLVEANRRQLLHAGLLEGSIYTVGACTSCETSRFFSYRAQSGTTGRMMAVVGKRMAG